jgi:hypothetical protein
MKIILEIILKKVFSNIILFNQLEIQPMSNIACPGVMFLHLPILGGWLLDQFPYGRHFKLKSAFNTPFNTRQDES